MDERIYRHRFHLGRSTLLEILFLVLWLLKDVGRDPRVCPGGQRAIALLGRRPCRPGSRDGSSSNVSMDGFRRPIDAYQSVPFSFGRNGMASQPKRLAAIPRPLICARDRYFARINSVCARARSPSVKTWRAFSSQYAMRPRPSPRPLTYDGVVAPWMKVRKASSQERNRARKNDQNSSPYGLPRWCITRLPYCRRVGPSDKAPSFAAKI